MRSTASRLASRILSTQQQLATLADLVEALTPKPPVITSDAEARAVMAYLLACRRGSEELLREQAPLVWKRVLRVMARTPDGARRQQESRRVGDSRDTMSAMV